MNVHLKEDLVTIFGCLKPDLLSNTLGVPQSFKKPFASKKNFLSGAFKLSVKSFKNFSNVLLYHSFISQANIRVFVVGGKTIIP
jgi:hypothetical protein